MLNAFEPMSQFYVINLRGAHYLCSCAVHGACWLNPIKRLPDAFWSAR